MNEIHLYIVEPSNLYLIWNFTSTILK